MIQNRWDQSLSPGNEQAFYWGSAAADADGTRNYMGVKSPAVDAMIAALLKAHERDEFVAAVRALDRVLMSGFYVVPLYHLPEQWVARWTTIAHPAATSLFGYLPETWWRSRSRASNDPRRYARPNDLPADATLDDLFRRAAARRPDALALVDPPDRDSFTDGAPRRLTYAQADRVVSAIAARLRTLGLPTDAVVGIQLAQHGRERAGAARRAARRPDRGAAAAAVAARRCGGARSAASAPRPSSPRPHRRFRRLRDGHAGRGRYLFDPLCLRLRPQSARRRDCARTTCCPHRHSLAACAISRKIQVSRKGASAMRPGSCSQMDTPIGLQSWPTIYCPRASTRQSCATRSMPRVADRTDVVAELQRAEIRTYVRSLPLTERTALALSLSAISWV